MKLGEYVKMYIRERDLELSTACQYQCSVSHFESWHGGPIGIEDELTTDLVNDYLQHMKEAGRSTHTRKSRRNNLVVLWRAICADRRFDFNRDYSYIQRVNCQELENDGFSPSEVEKLVLHCRSLEDLIPNTQVPRSAYFESFVLASWDSGLRLGDVLRFTTETVNRIEAGEGHLRVLQNKSKRYVDCYFQPWTIDALQRCLAFQPRDLVWPLWAKRRGAFFEAFRNVIETAGLRGTTKYLRRAAATDAEIYEEGAASQVLGHSPNSHGLAEKHYIVRKIMPRRAAPRRTPLNISTPSGGTAAREFMVALEYGNG